MNQESMAHNIATAFASSENGKIKLESPQEKLTRFVEDYCTAYGYVMNLSEDFLKEQIHRGEM